jgi:acetoacetate decarboxylase
MKHETVRTKAFAMPLTNPAFPPGPYRFVNREYFIIQYRTDPEALRRIVPEPLELTEPVVNYEFIRMPDSTGFGDCTESGQVILVSWRGQAGSFTHQMFSTIIRPSPVDASCGASPRNWRSRSSPSRSTRWSAP